MPGNRSENLSRSKFEEWLSPTGALVVGIPSGVTERILWEIEALGNIRFLAQIGPGGLPFKETATIKSNC